jgi:hypothetical protein
VSAGPEPADEPEPVELDTEAWAARRPAELALPGAEREWLAREVERMYPGHPWSGRVRPEAE